jgi:hypothetical protein
MIRESIARLGALSLSLVLLAGCAGVEPGSTAQPASSPEPTATAGWSAPAAPSAQIPGTCRDLVPDERAAAFATPVVDPAEPWYRATAASAAAAVQAGTLECGWVADPTRSSETLWMIVNRGSLGFDQYPGGAPEPALAADDSSLTCSGFATSQSCNLWVNAGDFGVIAGASRNTDDPAGFRAEFVAVMAEVVASLRSASVPAAWAAPAGSWPLEIDCAAVASAPAFAAAAGWPDAVVDSQFGNAPSYGDGGATYCAWVDSARDVGVIGDMVAGGSWFWPSFAALPGFVALDIPGADVAGVVCDGSEGSCQAAAVVGVNLVSAVNSGDFGHASGPEVTAGLSADLAGVVAGLTAVY